MSYRSTAAKVAQQKAERPEAYCPKPRCLWRTGGTYCPRHTTSVNDQIANEYAADTLTDEEESRILAILDAPYVIHK